jgi:hypothetical protein
MRHVVLFAHAPSATKALGLGDGWGKQEKSYEGNDQGNQTLHELSLRAEQGITKSYVQMLVPAGKCNCGFQGRMLDHRTALS